MNKKLWIENYVLQFMANIDAIHYQQNCSNGWGDKTFNASIEDAYYLGEIAWKRLQEHLKG